jgi:hypothetical protein
MHETRPAKITSPIVSLSDGYVRTIPVALIVAAVGIVLSFILLQGPERFLYAYLVNFAFLLSICLGCLFFVIIMFLTRAGWSVTVRRIAELYAMCTPYMAILFLPILVTTLSGASYLYPWVDGGWSVAGAGDALTNAAVEDLPPLEQMKRSFLNPSFFAARWIGYFIFWGLAAAFFLFTSLKQDKEGGVKLTHRMQAVAAPALILFAATVVFASFDLEMSLEPFWFSTMFPVYFFAGGVLAALATITLTALWLQRTGRVTDEITIEHYHDLGKLMHGFVVFWGYIAFSQFLLIWYANIPEETFWYDIRINKHGWKTLTYVLLIGHLFVPFLAMMGRTVRRNKTFLAGATVWLLLMHWLDHFWLVVPHYSHAPGGHLREDTVATSFFFFLGDVCCTVGMIAAFVAIFCLVARSRPLVPLQDPRLGEALNHEVH